MVKLFNKTQPISERKPKPLIKSLTLCEYNLGLDKNVLKECQKRAERKDKVFDYGDKADIVAKTIAGCADVVKEYGFPEANKLMQTAVSQCQTFTEPISKDVKGMKQCLETIENATLRIERHKREISERKKQIRRFKSAYSKPTYTVEELQYLALLGNVRNGEATYSEQREERELRDKLLAEARENVKRWREENEVEQVKARLVGWSVNPHRPIFVQSHEIYRQVKGVYEGMGSHIHSDMRDEAAGAFVSVFYGSDLGIPCGTAESVNAVIDTNKWQIVSVAGPDINIIRIQR